MFGLGQQHNRAAEAAITILTHHFDPDRPRGQLFFEITEVIKKAMAEANSDRGDTRFKPSEN
jgi:hypothetical protein